MDENKTDKMPDLIDTTDCLEAIGAIRSMKNFLFVVIFVCLMIIQAVFWIDQGGRIDKSPSAGCPMGCKAFCEGKVCLSQEKDAVAAKVEKSESPIKPIEEAAKAVTGALSSVAEKVIAGESNAPAVAVIQNEASVVEANAPAAQPVAAKGNAIPAIFKIRPSCWAVSLVVKACNFILVIAATMYCLMLLMSLKISLTGRLGGINHISRAFFISLFALVILLPWQALLPGVVVGVIYQPQELLCDWSLRAESSIFWMVMCYLRFFCLWLVVVWLFIWAQIRSGKWARATLRRLGLVR
jgi:hypothetical protein